MHFGHLRTALEVAQQYQLDEVRLLPCHIPPHRETPTVSSHQRLDMLRLATASVDRFVVDDRELRSTQTSYTVTTLRSLAEALPDAQLYFFMGEDAFAGFTAWHQWEEILRLCRLIIMKRPQSITYIPAIETLLDEHMKRPLEQAGAIRLCSVTQLAISATYLREEMQAQRNVRYLLPDPVIDYILQNGLYGYRKL